jgi:hypothetical protein
VKTLPVLTGVALGGVLAACGGGGASFSSATAIVKAMNSDGFGCQGAHHPNAFFPKATGDMQCQHQGEEVLVLTFTSNHDRDSWVAALDRKVKGLGSRGLDYQRFGAVHGVHGSTVEGDRWLVLTERGDGDKIASALGGTVL